MNYAARQTADSFDNGVFTAAQLSYISQVKNVPQVTPYGFFSMPPVGSSWCILPLRDNDNDMVGFGNDYVRRPTDLKSSDVCLFNTESKVKVVLRTTGDLEIYAPNNINVNADNDINLTAGNNINVTATTDIVLTAEKNISATATENITIEADVADINITTSATIDCPDTTWTGNITHDGDFINTGNVTSNNVTLHTHTHTSTSPGSPTSSPNVPS